ncbi:hypothetical protein INT45_002705 [Circinella minor]|uniref:Uncharacterized protein n=1 Tax=Circinella minor TaxID=1195481 RepID=A0A8H7S4N1_9FUNG|nr:hypothetical protein INT45_002705 [Circinella minor]
MPHYAAFCMERAIGELKRRVHSVRDAGVNSENVVVEIAAIRRRNRLQEPQERKRKTVLASTLANSPKIWGPFSKKSATDMKCVTQLKNFWAIHQDTYNTIIDQHQELETVYGGKNHSFIRIITKVNTDLSWTSSIRPEKHQYFGFIRNIFAHEYNNCQKLLAVVDVAELIENHSLWPYRTRSARLKRCVIQVKNIAGFANRVVGKNGHEYIFWSQLESYKKEPPIDYKLKYLL